MLFSILASNAIALPISPAFPHSEIEYILDNADARILLATRRSASIADRFVKRENLTIDVREPILRSSSHANFLPRLEQLDLPDVNTLDSKGGLMLYTSGTTNRPVRLFHPTLCFNPTLCAFHSVLGICAY